MSFKTASVKKHEDSVKLEAHAIATGHRHDDLHECSELSIDSDIALPGESKQSTALCFVKRKKGQNRFMFYPDDPFKDMWDMLIALILIFTCLVTPYRLALVEKDNMGWQVTTVVVDILFLIDILIIFNSAYLDENYITIQDRK